MSWELATASAAGCAAVVNVGAALYMRRAVGSFTHTWGLLFLYTAFFSGFYSAMFFLLASGDYDRGHWSETMTPFSFLIFITVWVAPAILATANSVVVRRTIKEASGS